jgi:hypothetical protein
MGRRRVDPLNLTAREQQILTLYRRYELSGLVGRGWKARAQRELKWGAGEFQRNWGLLVAQGIIEDPGVEDELDPTPQEQCVFCGRRLRVYAAKRRKAQESVYDLDGSGSTSPILTPVELDRVLRDQAGGSTVWERSYRARVAENRREVRHAVEA